MSTNTTASTELTTFSPEELSNALLDFDDFMHRAVLQSIYMLLGETAYQAKHSLPLEGDHLDAGIQARYLTDNVRALFTDAALKDMSVPVTVEEFSDKRIIMRFRGVPVHIKILYRHYSWLENLDSVIYSFEDFQIPNQFDKYWKARFIVQ